MSYRLRSSAELVFGFFTFEQWDAEGRKDSDQVGIEKARNWLSRYELPDMDREIDRALLEFIRQRESEEAGS